MWTFVLTDLAYVPVGEILNASDRTVDLPLNKLSSASFKIRMDNPLAEIISTTEGYIKAYRDGELMHFGPIVSTEESAATGAATIAVNSMGAGWILGKRLAGTSTTGTVYSTLWDRAKIVKNLIDGSNTLSNTGIATTGSITAASSITYIAGPYRPILDVLQELAASIDGFDWSFVPTDNFAGGVVTSQTIAQYIAAPAFGSVKQHAVFEYGVGLHNIASYKSTVTRDTQANRVFHVVDPGTNPTYPQVMAEDTISESKWKMLQDVANADLISQASRLALVQDHVAIRKNPRRLVEFTPHIDPNSSGRLPQFGVDYGLGDFVRARVQYGDTVRLDNNMRVWGISFNIDEEGMERTTLALMET